MASEDSREPEVRLTAKAQDDLKVIDLVTAETWGERQANIYLSDLRRTLQLLAHNPEMGQALPDRKPYRRFLSKLHGRRQAHGHHILYRPISSGIRVVRLLHTALDWSAELKDEEE